jgi:hypothetical protein
MKSIRKPLTTILLAIATTTTIAQAGNANQDWKIYRAYNNPTSVVKTPNKTFAVYDGSLMSYNPQDGETKTYSILNGLNDTEIKFLKYCPEAKALVIVYENGNIDLFESENNIHNIPSILRKEDGIKDKTIYNLEIAGNMAYLSTDFGVVTVDVKKHVIPETFGMFAMSTRSVCFNGNTIYAATTEGIKKADTNANLQDNTNWLPADNIFEWDKITFATKILFFDGHFICLHLWNQLDFHAKDESTVQRYMTEVTDVSILNGMLVVTTVQDGTYFFRDVNTFFHLPLTVNDIDSESPNAGNVFWVAVPGQGIAEIKIADGFESYSTTLPPITINSPKRNINMNLLHTAGKLFVTGGGRTTNRSYLPGTLMIYDAGKWTAIDDEKVSQETGLTCLDFMSVAVDPLNSSHCFVSSWGEGVYEFLDNEFVKLYSYDNSSLQVTLPVTDPNMFNRYVRADGLAWDKEHNLYVTNALVENGLSVLSDNNKWESLYFESLSGRTAETNGVLIDSSNRKWINVWRLNKSGITVIDENNRLIGACRQFTDQLGTVVPVINYLCMAEDNEQNIWVGTDNGPIIISDAKNVANNTCYRRTVTNQYGDNKYMLENERINAIAVDGGNRKWLGTENSGLFVIEESGSNIKIDNFNTENSFLLSDKINSLALDPLTGELFIGTDRGLCSYMSNAPQGQPDYGDVYAFPNPVHPNSDTRVTVTGLVEGSTVKITDTAGRLITEGRSLGSNFTWNLRNRRNETVKAGIYLVFASTETGDKGIVTKIMVIK